MTFLSHVIPFAQPKVYVLTKYQNLAAIFSGGSETLSIYLIKPEQKPLCILSNGSVYFKQSGMIGVREWNAWVGSRQQI